MSLQQSPSESSPRKEKWTQIEKNIKHRKDPKTTLKLCKALLEEIQKGHYPDEEVKAKLYIHHLNYQIADDTDALNQNLLNEIDEDIKSMTFPQKNYMALIAYKLVEEYRLNNSWEIEERKNANYNSKDFTTWRTQDFQEKSDFYKAIVFENSKELKQIPLNNFKHLMFINGNKATYLETAYQAFIYTDLQFQKRRLYEEQLSSLDIEDAFTGQTSNPLLQKFIDDSKTLEKTFKEDLQLRLEMEFWTHLVNLQSNPKIEEIYLNNLLAINTLNNDLIKAERNYRIAQLYHSKAEDIYWSGVKNPKDIVLLKQKKTDRFNKSIQYLDLIMDHLDPNLSERAKEIVTNSKHLKTSITEHTTLSITGEESYLSNQDLVFGISTRNLKTLNLEVYKLNPIEYYNKQQSLSWNDRKTILSHLKNKTLEWSGTYNITPSTEYTTDIRQLIVPGLDYGFYAITSQGDPSKCLLFQVSDLYVERDGKKITVKSAKDYSVVKDAVLCEGDGQSKCHSFNKNGELNFSSKDRNFYSVLNGEDAYHLFEQTFFYYDNSKRYYTYYKDEIFTDRAIYRPGQMVHVKILQKHKPENEILYTLSKGSKVKVELLNTQFEVIQTKTVSLNEFSSGYISFKLPNDVLNGHFTIRTEHASESIQVEEYKRPTFFVEFSKDSTEKRIGDIIKLPIKAQTFSDIPLNDAKLQYTIKYSNMPVVFWRCGYFNWSEEYILNHQTTTLNKKGEYILEINSNDIPESMKEQNVVQFTVEVKVVDINGDSETESTSFSLSNKGLQMNTLPNGQIIEHDSLINTVHVTNFQDISLDKIIDYTIWKLQEPKHILQHTHAISEASWLLPDGYKTPKGLEHLSILNAISFDTWNIESKITSGTISANQKSSINPNLTTGTYKIHYTVKDEKDSLITNTRYIQVYPKKGKLNIKNENIVALSSQKFYRVDETYTNTLYLPFSSKYYYVLSDFKGVLKSGVVNGGSVIKLTQNIASRSKGGISLKIKSVYNNKVYTYETRHMVDWDMRLITKWVNIRNKIQPQSEEDWKLEIKDSEGRSVPTEVLALMYDASLDEIKKHNISQHMEFLPSYSSSKYLTARRISPYFTTHFHSNSLPFYATELSELNTIQFESTLDLLRLGRIQRSFSSRSRSGKSETLMAYMTTESIDMNQADDMVQSVRGGRSAKEEEYAVDGVKVSGTSNISNQVSPPNSKSETKTVQIRKNFEETIFFYPELISKTDGIVDIPFTMTDGIGKYKLMLYGHTEDLKQFYLEEEIISNKELMVEMHKPRFLYSGDKMIWTAKVSNLSDVAQHTQIQLKLTDAINQTLIFESDKAPSSILLQPGESQSVRWECTIPEHMVGEITYELRAETDKFVDIEINQVPILTTQKLINENFALTIPANQSKTVKLSELLNTSQYEQFRIDCMTNPIWQVIKALPYAKSKDDKIISNLLDEYITIKIGQHILNKNPNISERLLALSKQKPNSELRNNQDLKAITLEESPWLIDAKNQEEELLALAHFFNKNMLSSRLKTLERKISKHQNSSGGFPWIKGGKDSYSMSLYVAKSLSHLEKLNLGKNDLKSLKTKLFQYLDQEITKHYNRLKKHGGLANTKVSHIPYLESRTYFLNDYTIQKSALPAYTFFLEKSLEHWTDAHFVNRISLAKIAHGNGKLKISDDIFKTINEYRIDDSNQQTIYWKQLANGLSWQNRKFVNHADLIHLYVLQGNHESDISKLQNWLLQQKHSQHWDSSSETSQLVYALLFNVDDSHIFDPVQVDIKLNGKSIEFTQSEAWLSKTWLKENQIDIANSVLEVYNPSNRPIWVSGYQQYFSKISEVKAEKSTICTIEKTFYKRQITNNVEEWIKTKLEDLAIGDEIKVNMKLNLPQQLDFVYLQDYFAACFEPIERISGFKYDRKGSYYLNIKDHKMQFFFDHIARGVHEFEFQTRVKQLGTFSNGFAEFQSYYAPDFGGHSDAQHVSVNPME